MFLKPTNKKPRKTGKRKGSKHEKKYGCDSFRKLMIDVVIFLTDGTVLPVYPATQSQWKSFTSSVQFPLFWHGCPAQSSMSELK